MRSLDTIATTAVPKQQRGSRTMAAPSRNAQLLTPDELTGRLDELYRALDEFNDGYYFESHETLEDLWLVTPLPERTLFQGIIQIAAAYVHLARGEVPGAISCSTRRSRSCGPLSRRRSASTLPRWQGRRRTCASGCRQTGLAGRFGGCWPTRRDGCMHERRLARAGWQRWGNCNYTPMCFLQNAHSILVRGVTHEDPACRR